MERTVYLIKNKVRINDGLDVKGQSLVIPFTNMDVASASTDANQHITLVSEALLDQKIASSVANSHKAVRGTINVADMDAVNATIATFNSGQPITTNEGEYSVAKSVPGDIIFFRVSTSGLTEEAVVGTDGNMSLLTKNTIQTQQIATLRTDVDADRRDIALLRTDVSTLSNDKANKLDVYAKTETYSKAEVNSSQAAQDQEIKNVDGRVKAIEDAVTITDVSYLWDGLVANQHLLTTSFDLKTLNSAFSFEEGKKSELAIQRISTGTIVSHPITASAAVTQVEYAWAEDGGKQINIDTDVNGVLVVTFGNGVNTSNYRIFEVIQKVPATLIAVGYTKVESDAKYQLKTDNALVTTSKATTGAINEINQKVVDLTTVVGTKATQADLTTLTTTVGTKVAQADFDTYKTATDAKINAIDITGFYTKAEVDSKINAAIAAALSKTMSVTFSDSTSDDYKIGH